MNYTLPEELPAACVRSIVIREGEILVQRPPNPRSCYAFIAGHYEPGDTLEYRLATEFEEETNAKLLSCPYLFVVESGVNPHRTRLLLESPRNRKRCRTAMPGRSGTAATAVVRLENLNRTEIA